MDASSSSSRYFTAKAEESPSTVVDVAAGLGSMTVVGAEEASTSGRTEYYSARCEAMARSRGQFSDDIALEIEFSKFHWSEMSGLEVASQSSEEEELNRENKEVLRQLREDHDFLFGRDLSGYVLGRMIAKGGQAGIYEVVGHPEYLMKVFERGTSLRDLRQVCPLPVLDDAIRHCIYYAGMLNDKSFAFLMEKCWGDLRKLIDQVMLEKNVEGIQGPPFPYNGWEEEEDGWSMRDVHFMYGIALHMMHLHEEGVCHRDLKASNILLRNDFGRWGIFVEYDGNCIDFDGIVVADFECSIGVLGTGFWRAPEVLAVQGNASAMTNEQWKKADVYSYGMILFEIVTGRIPFDGELGNTKAHRQLVIEGQRPQLPSDLDNAVKDLITKCWAPNPSLRPTFSEIVEMVETISTSQCQFRLFGINDELPPQYRLATVQEVKDYPIASMKAMPKLEKANLAIGSVGGYSSGIKIRLEERSNACHKLARLHL